MEVRVARWLAKTFVIPSGISQGQPFELQPFQMELLREFFAKDGQSPKWRAIAYSIARKQGKTMLMAALFLALMCPDSPAHQPNFRGSIAAPSERHALFVPNAMRDLMEAAGRAEELKRRADPKPGIIYIGNATLLLSTGTRSQGHGQDCDLICIDECGLLSQNQTEMVDGMTDAIATRDGQILYVGTRGDGAFFNDILDNPDPRTCVILYAADKGDDMSDPAVWRKANPGLGTIKPVRFMKDAHDKAEQSGSMTAFGAWNLNMPLTPGRELLIDYETLAKAYRKDAEPIPGEPVHIGIDLGGSASMTAATVAYETSGIIKVLGAFPGAALSLEERGKRDLVGDLWARCAAAGELIETSGSVSDLAEFLPELIERVGPHPVRSVSCDRYRQAEFETALARSRIAWPIIYRGTGPKDGDADIRATRRLFIAGAVTLKRSLLLEGSLAEADVKVSTTGACQLQRAHQTARIDVVSSLVLACSAMLRARDAVKPEYTVEVL
ncbi:terminase TerL endonuclease subunit [Roseovarius sp. THAF27]|uniref:terminase TerL endonuclease subunit n=1 Tax=Roseovarius sp. THAF27 TaxID=2587850 RepID=UPI00156284D7|nr:terminase TerL endonuclease subunit [Roseovarius sp. THAF27]